MSPIISTETSEEGEQELKYLVSPRVSIAAMMGFVPHGSFLRAQPWQVRPTWGVAEAAHSCGEGL